MIVASVKGFSLSFIVVIGAKEGATKTLCRPSTSMRGLDPKHEATYVSFSSPISNPRDLLMYKPIRVETS